MAGDPKLTPLLNVEAVESSARFYREAFGLELTDSWSNEGRMRWAELERGAFALMPNEQGEGSAETYALRQFVLRDPDGYELAVTSPITR